MSQRRRSRPFSVTITSSILLIYAALTLWVFIDVNFLKRTEGWDDPIMISYSLVSPFLCAASGAYMLRGANWARILFFTGCFPLFAAFIVFMMMTSHVEPRVLLRCVAVGLLSTRLLSRRANRFFTGRDTVFVRKPREQREPERQERRESQRVSRRRRYDY